MKTYKGFKNQEELEEVVELIERIVSNSFEVSYDDCGIMSIRIESEFDGLTVTLNLWSEGGEVIIDETDKQSSHNRIILSNEGCLIDDIKNLYQTNLEGVFDLVYEEESE